MKRRILVLALAVFLVFSLGMSSVVMAAAEEILPVETPLQDELLTEEVPSFAESAVPDEFTEQSAMETADAKIMAGNYNATDVAALKAFLSKPSAIAGNTNAQALGYDINNPDTWKDVSWNDEGQAYSVRWDNKNLAGDMDVTACTELGTISIQNNKITSLDWSCPPNMHGISVYGNPMKRLNGYINGQLLEIEVVGNGSIYLYPGTVAFALLPSVTEGDNAVFDGWYDAEGKLISKNRQLASREYEGYSKMYARFEDVEFSKQDVAAMQIFLNQSSKTKGKTNAEIINWDIDDPNSWRAKSIYNTSGVFWDTDGRISQISLGGENLGGDVNFSKMENLQSLSIYGSIDEVDFSGNSNLRYIGVTATSIAGKVKNTKVSYSAEKGKINYNLQLNPNGTINNSSVNYSPKDDSKLAGWFDENNKLVSVAWIVQLAESGAKVVKYPTLRARTDVKVTPVSKVSLPIASAVVGKSKSIILSASISPSDANNKELTWSSSDTKIATVSDNGVVKGVGVGKAIITATAKDGSEKSAKCTITVSSKLKPITALSLNKTSLTLNAKKTAGLTAKITPTNAANKKLIWTSSNTKVAKVDRSGRVTAVSKGSATITAKATDGSSKKATCKVTVK